MAGDYIVQNQQRTVQILGPANVVDVMEVGFTTLPHNIYAVALVPLGPWEALGAPAFIEPIATGIESVVGGAYISGASFAQDLDGNGLLSSFIDFVVTVPPPTPLQAGPMSAIVRVPLYAFGESVLRGPLINGPIDRAIAALQGTAGL